MTPRTVTRAPPVRHTPRRTPAGRDRRLARDRRHRVLVGLELGTGASALLCGALLAARPDGSLMGMPLRVLANSPFDDFRAPGLLLAGLVGGGYLLAGASDRRRTRYRRSLSVVAGAGLVLFEAVEWAWIGFHPLQAVFMGVGVAVVGLALADVTPRDVFGASAHRRR